jgi:hypothetical protein
MKNTSIIVIVLICAFALYLIYQQMKNKSVTVISKKTECPECPPCKQNNQYRTGQQDNNVVEDFSRSKRGDYGRDNMRGDYGRDARDGRDYAHDRDRDRDYNINLNMDNTDPYADPIKKMDLHSMYDPLTFPQTRLSREVLDKYEEYFEKHGNYPPFGYNSKPLFDNAIMNGILVKQTNEEDGFGNDTNPMTVSLFRMKSPKNVNRFYYYVIDPRYMSKIENKFPLESIRINSIRFNNADVSGLPEIYNDDIIDGITIFPGSKYRATIYRTGTFP